MDQSSDSACCNHLAGGNGNTEFFFEPRRNPLWFVFICAQLFGKVSVWMQLLEIDAKRFHQTVQHRRCMTTVKAAESLASKHPRLLAAPSRGLEEPMECVEDLHGIDWVRSRDLSCRRAGK